MAISTHAELKTAVANTLARSDLTARIAEFVELAHDKLNLRLRIRAMEASVDLTVDDQEVALPTRYQSMRRLYLDGDPVKALDYVAPTDFWRKYMSSQTDKPDAYTIEGDNLIFGPAPDSTYTGKALFWQAFEDLTADGDTNWLLTNAAGAYYYGALIEASLFLDNRSSLMKWAALQDDILAQIEKADKRSRFSGAPLIVRTDVGMGRRRPRRFAT